MYPASFIPDFTTASAMLLMRSSLTSQPNLFHEFHPMGGVRARFADGDLLSCATLIPMKREMLRYETRTARFVFMQMFYQKCGGVGTYSRGPANTQKQLCPPQRVARRIYAICQDCIGPGAGKGRPSQDENQMLASNRKLS